jgi:hypothetical protein
MATVVSLKHKDLNLTVAKDKGESVKRQGDGHVDNITGECEKTCHLNPLVANCLLKL